MPLAGLENTTGSRLFVAAGEPANFLQPAVKAMTWLEIVGLVTMGPWGDTVADVAEGVVSEDRVIHTNGIRDGGTVPLVIQHRTTDAGTALLLTTDGGNTLLTFRRSYKSGDQVVAAGLIAPMRERGLGGDTIRGWTTDAKINTGLYRFTAAAWAV